MAYTAVPIVATGDLWTASNHNTYIRDNFAAGVPDIFTTKGDLAAATAANAATRVPVGANGNLLLADSAQSGGMKWIGLSEMTYPARAYLSAVQGITSSTLTIVAWDAESYDPAGVFTVGANAKYTAPITGYYLVTLGLHYLSGNWAIGDSAEGRIYKNGVHYSTPAVFLPNVNASLGIAIRGSDIVQLNASQYIDIRAWQTAGSQINLGTAGLSTFVSIARIG